MAQSQGFDLADAWNRITNQGQYDTFKHKGSIAENINPWGKDTAEFQSGMVNPFNGNTGDTSNAEMGKAIQAGDFQKAHEIFGAGPQNVIGQGNYNEKKAQGWDTGESLKQADATSANSAAGILAAIFGGSAAAGGGSGGSAASGGAASSGTAGTTATTGTQAATGAKEGTDIFKTINDISQFIPSGDSNSGGGGMTGNSGTDAGYAKAMQGYDEEQQKRLDRAQKQQELRQKAYQGGIYG